MWGRGKSCHFKRIKMTANIQIRVFICSFQLSLHLNPLKFASKGVSFISPWKSEAFFSSKHPLYFVNCCLFFSPYPSLCFCNIAYFSFPLWLIPLYCFSLIALQPSTHGRGHFPHSLLSPLFFLFHFLSLLIVFPSFEIVSHMQISPVGLIKLLLPFCLLNSFGSFSRNNHTKAFHIN